MRPTIMGNLRTAFRMVAFTASTLASVLSERVAYLETKMVNLYTEFQALKTALITLDKELENVHGFCEDLAQGKWTLGSCFRRP